MMGTSPLFAGLRREEKETLRHSAARRNFVAGETLFTQGGSASELFVITKGRVKVWRASEDGGALTLTLLGSGAPLGTLGAADDALNHATATALTGVEALSWPITRLRALMETSPTLTANVLRTVTTYAEQLIERLEEMSSTTVEQRLARTLLRLARRVQVESANLTGCELPLSRQDLADLTSATLPTVSRIMSRWRSGGLIAGTRGRVRLIDQVELSRIAERPAT